LETFDHRVLHPNTSEGYTAEETLDAFLTEEYDFSIAPPWLADLSIDDDEEG
jgi:hypothetical protein